MQLSDNMRGALLMTGSMTAFTLNDACMKLLGETLPVWQAMALRGVATTACLLALTLALGQLRFRHSARDWRLIGLRGAAEAGSAWLFITALNHMEIANLSAILQSLPLTVTLASALFFGERIGWRRMLAIVVGFLGVMLIVKPSGNDFNIYSVYGLLTVLFVTVRDLCARRISRDVPSLMIATITAGFVALVACIGMTLEPSAPVGGHELALLAGAVLFVIGGYVFSVGAMRVGEIGFVSPFRYMSLLVAMIVGAVVFGTFPDGTRLTGAAIVVATGLFTLWREWTLRRVRRPVLPVGRP